MIENKTGFEDESSHFIFNIDTTNYTDEQVKELVEKIKTELKLL